MNLQNGCRNLRCHRAKKCVMHDLRLIGSAGNDQNLSGLHDGLDSHGKCIVRNILRIIKQSCIGFNGALRQRYQMCFLLKGFIRFIKTDMAVIPLDAS